MKNKEVLLQMAKILEKVIWKMKRESQYVGTFYDEYKELEEIIYELENE